jgi:hypothetical protein
LPEKVAPARAEAHAELAATIGRDLSRLLVAQTDVLVDGRVTDRTHLGAGLAAHQALRAGGQAGSRDMLALGLHLAPLLLAGDRPRDAVAVATDALAATPTPEQVSLLHGHIARGLLQLGRHAEALPHVQQRVRPTRRTPRSSSRSPVRCRRRWRPKSSPCCAQ